MTTAVRFQALPPLSPEEYQALEQSILTHGVMVAVLVDEDGIVIDGHHRQKIASEHNLDCPIEIVCDRSDAEKRTLALSLNLDRRNLTREQRRALVSESIKADPQLSDREHGRRTGVSPTTVGGIRHDLEKVSKLDTFERRVDPRSGKASQPAPKPPSPRPPRRKPFIDLARELALDLPRVTKRLESFGTDDRLAGNKDVAASQLCHYLSEMVSAGSALCDQLKGEMQ